MLLHPPDMLLHLCSYALLLCSYTYALTPYRYASTPMLLCPPAMILRPPAMILRLRSYALLPQESEEGEVLPAMHLRVLHSEDAVPLALYSTRTA